MAAVDAFGNGCHRHPTPEPSFPTYPSFPRTSTFQGLPRHPAAVPTPRPAHLPALQVTPSPQFYTEDDDIPICTPVAYQRPLTSPPFSLPRTNTFSVATAHEDAFVRAHTYPAVARYAAGVPSKHTPQMPRSPGSKPTRSRSKTSGKLSPPVQRTRSATSRTDALKDGKPSRRVPHAEEAPVHSPLPSRKIGKSSKSEELVPTKQEKVGKGERKLPSKKTVPKESSSTSLVKEKAEKEKLPKKEKEVKALPGHSEATKRRSSKSTSPPSREGKAFPLESTPSATASRMHRSKTPDSRQKEGSAKVLSQGHSSTREASRKAVMGPEESRERKAEFERAKTPRREKQVRFADTVQVRNVMKAAKGDQE